MSKINIINGKKLAQKILNRLKNKISKLPKKPGLAAILVGHDDPPSYIYVALKEKAAKTIGVRFEKYLLPSSTPQTKIIKLIKSLNRAKQINAILVQLPLPKKFNTHKIIASISDHKDVDGFKRASLLTPPTLAGIIELIKSTNSDLKNKHACILANSQIFGLPLERLLKQEGVRVTSLIVKQKTQKIVNQIKTADIVIIALGHPKFLTADDIKKGSIIIDVGINRIGKKIIGDVDFKSVSRKAGSITPVPGGVGPMTVACLMENVYKLYLEQNAQ